MTFKRPRRAAPRINPFLLPEDLYVFRVAGAQPKQSKATGRDYVMLTLVVAEGPYIGNVIYKPIIDSRQAAWVWERVFIRGIDEPEELIGKFMLARIRHDAYMCATRAGIRGQLYPTPIGLARELSA